MRRLGTFRTSVLVCLAWAAPRAGLAQRATSADSSLRHGLVDRAESLYYAGVRSRPRDPAARFDLGAFLIARGASRIGMTLVEEAMQFGFDKDRAGRALAPVYLGLGEYRKLLALPGSALSTGERERARYLDAHPSRTTAPDSSVDAAYAPATNGTSLGAVTIRVNGKALTATIVNGGPEIALAEGLADATHAHRFAPETVRGRIETPVVVDSIGISRLGATNVPVTLVPMPGGSDARVSLAFLARYAPTFDSRARLLTLRTSGSIAPAAITGNVFVTLRADDQLTVLKAGGWVPLDDPSIVGLLGGRRWTLDAKHGIVAVAP